MPRLASTSRVGRLGHHWATAERSGPFGPRRIDTSNGSTVTFLHKRPITTSRPNPGTNSNIRLFTKQACRRHLFTIRRKNCVFSVFARKSVSSVPSMFVIECPTLIETHNREARGRWAHRSQRQSEHSESEAVRKGDRHPPFCGRNFNHKIPGASPFGQPVRINRAARGGIRTGLTDERWNPNPRFPLRESSQFPPDRVSTRSPIVSGSTLESTTTPSSSISQNSGISRTP